MATVGRVWRTWHLMAATTSALVLGIAIGVTTGDSDGPTAVVAGPSTSVSPPETRETATSQTSSVLTQTTQATAPATTLARPTTTVATVPTGRSRARPLPLGTEGILVDPQWTVSVIDVTPDANAIVQRENRFNDPPAEGHQFFMARVRMTYRGQDSESPLIVDLEAVGASNVVYRDSCGVIPDDYTHANRVFAGGTIEGNVCWSIRSSDAESLTMIAHRLFNDRDVLYLALR